MKAFFTGDIYLKENRKKIFSDEFIEKINKYDIRCCNLEGPISDNKYIEKIGPAISQNKKIVEFLNEANFNMINIANNHIMDCGKEGLIDTLKHCEGKIIIGAGENIESAYKEYIYRDNDVSIAFLSIAENGFGCCKDDMKLGYAWCFSYKIENKIKELKKTVDYIVVNCHMGAENLKVPLPEVKEFYHHLIDLGVKYIIGHHPHVIQAYEFYNSGVIFYSLGNTYFDINLDKQDKNSFCVMLELKKDKTNFEIIPTYIDEDDVLYIGGNANQQLRDCNKCLEDGIYENKIKEFCNYMYNEIYIPYYTGCFKFDINSKKSRLKFAFEIIFKRYKINNYFLYHNIAIETHRWICQRACLNMMEEEKNEKIFEKN